MKERRPRRKALAVTAFVAAASLLVAGCGGSQEGGDPQARPEHVDLTVGVWGSSDRGDLYQQALDLFIEGQSDVEARMEFAERSKYYERLTTAAASKTLPDVFWLNDAYFTRYASSGMLLDLKPYLGDQIDTSGIAESWMPYGQIDDSTYGIASHFNGVATIVDQQILDDAGVTFDATTWDETFDIARQVTRPDEQVWGLEDVTLGFSQLVFWAWVRQHGQEMFNDEGKVGFDKQVLIDWWTMWDKLRQEGVIPPPDVQIESQAGGAATGLLTTSQVAIRWSSATHLSTYSGLREGADLALHPFPQTKDAGDDWRTFTALMLVAANSTDAPGVSAELINFLVNDQEAAAITKINMGTPTPAAVAESILPDLKETDEEVVRYLAEEQANPSRRTPPVPEAAEQFYDALARFSQEIAYGRMTPEAAADQLMTEADSILA